MKNITILLILLTFWGCVTNKHKEKEKQELNTKVELKSALRLKENNSIEKNETKKDSISINKKYSIEKNQLFALQNFHLKSSGKCIDPGVLRNVEFTDALGNKTLIPVNDNTELNFINETDFKKELEKVKSEKKQLSKTVAEIKSKYDKILSVNQELKQRINSKTSKTKTKTESSTIWQFALCAVLAIVFWELNKKLIKKYKP